MTSYLTKGIVLPKQLHTGCLINFEPHEILLSDMLEQSKDGIAIANKSGQFMYLSPSFGKALGFSKKELVEMSVFDLVHPDDLDALSASYSNCSRTGRQKKTEYRCRHKEGHYIWLEDTGQLFFDKEGQVRRVICLGRGGESTGRKKPPAILRERETRFNHLFNNSSVGIALVNEDGFVITINEAFCSFLGYFRDQILGNRISAYVDEEDKDIVMHLRMALFQSEKTNYVIEKRFRRKDGEVVWARLTISSIKETQSNCPYLLIVGEDITSLKEMEKVLQAQQNIYNAMLGALEEVSGASVRHHDEIRSVADLSVCLQSAGYEEVVAGYALEVVCELIETSGAYYAYDKSSKSLNLINLTCLNQTEHSLINKISSFKLGEKRGFIGVAGETRKAIYIPDVFAEPVCTMIGRDIKVRSCYLIPIYYGERLYGVLSLASQHVDGFSQRKRTLADNIASFISSVMENTRIFAETKTAFEKLNRTQRQLFQAQKMDAIGQLAGGMAHDINNQLTIIQACVDLYLPQVKEERLCDIFRKIYTAADRSANLTRQLMIFGRKQPQFKAAIDLNHNLILLQNVIDRLLEDDIDLQFDLAPDLYLINADSTNMDQIIINLTLNARDAMPKGGRLIIKTRNINHDLSAELPEYKGSSADKYICLSVADTGMGFDEQLKDRIFEPFFTTKGNYNGIGLGLPVVYGIVKSHGGWINVESKPDNGSIFEIYLPAFDRMAEAGD